MRVAIYVLFIGAVSADTAPPLQDIARAQQLYQTGDLDRAEKLLIDVVQASNQSLYTALAYSDLGAIYRDTGRSAAAERVLEQARTLLGQYKADPELNVAWLRTSINIASLYMETGQFGKAERIVNELRASPVPDGNEAVRVQAVLANLHMVRGRTAEAETLFLEVAEWWTKAKKPDEAATALNNLAVLAMGRNDFSTALTHIKRAWKAAVDGFGEDHPALVAVLANYGCALHRSGDHTSGLEWLERALSSAKRWHGPEGRLTVQVATLYSTALRESGRNKEARRVRSEVERMSSSLAARDPAVQTVDILDLAAEAERRSR